MDYLNAFEKIDSLLYDESSTMGECWMFIKAHIAELEAQLAAAQERNTNLQSEHLDHVSALHKRIKELEKKNDHK